MGKWYYGHATSMHITFIILKTKLITSARVDSLERLSRITGRPEEEIENEIRRLPTI